jgi:TonB family protein
VAGAVAVLLVAAAVLGWAFWQRSRAASVAEQPAVAESASPAPDAAQPAPAALPTTGELRVESEPAGARVRVNGESRGETPLVLPDLPFGDYEVRVERRGYEPQLLRSTLSAESPAGALQAVLVRAAAVTGSADVLSTPPGAEVVVDGRPAGRTPLHALALRPGSHRLALSLEGHVPWSGTIDVVAGQKGRVDVKLRPSAPAAPPPPPEPVVEAIDTERVYGLQDVDTPPRKLSGSSPSYPSDRMKRLRSGERVSVTLRFVVTETGEVRDVVVVESGGRVLDDVVVAAVRAWRYEPATKRGTRVKAQVMFKQTFLGG